MSVGIGEEVDFCGHFMDGKKKERKKEKIEIEIGIKKKRGKDRKGGKKARQKYMEAEQKPVRFRLEQQWQFGKQY